MKTDCGTVTEVEFTRNAITEDNAHDVQFKVRFKQVKPVLINRITLQCHVKASRSLFTKQM